jgi:hypothetical protein
LDKRAFVAGAPLAKNPVAAGGKTGEPEMRVRTPLATVAVLVLMQAGLPAHAGLIGNGTNTVSATSF